MCTVDNQTLLRNCSRYFLLFSYIHRSMFVDRFLSMSGVCVFLMHIYYFNILFHQHRLRLFTTHSWYLGPAVSQYHIKFILPEFVSYSKEKRVLCVRNGWHFCSPVLMMCNITFEVPRLSTFVFKKSSEKKIYTITLITFVVKSLTGFFAIMLAQRRRRWPNIFLQLGQCIVLSG